MGTADALTRNGNFILRVSIAIACLSVSAEAVIASRHCDPSPIRVEVQLEEVYVLGGPCLVAITLRNDGTKSVFLPYGLDLTVPQRAFSFNLRSVTTGSTFELRKPGLPDFYSVAEGPRGPLRWEEVELKPAEARRYLVDLTAYDLQLTIPSGEYVLEVLIYSGPDRLIQTATGPTLRLSESTNGEPRQVKQIIGPEIGGPRSLSPVVSTLKAAGDHLDEKAYSPRLERQLSFYELWAVLTGATEKRHLLEELAGDAATSVAATEAQVLLYELALQDDDFGSAVAIRESILDGCPECAWRITKADGDKGFLWRGRTILQIADVSTD